MPPATRLGYSRMTLELPNRLFLDTRDLINLSHLQQGRELRNDPGGHIAVAYGELLGRMRNGKLSIVLSIQAIYEWFKGGESAALEIAAVVDSASNILCVEGDTNVMVLEVLNECKRLKPDLPFGPWKLIRNFSDPDMSMPFISRHFLPLFAPQKAKPIDWVPIFRSVRHRIEAFAPKLGTASWPRNLDATFAETLQRSLAGLPRSPELSPRDKAGWLSHGLFMSPLLDLFVVPEERTRLLEAVDLANCPGASLFFRTYWQYARANTTTRPHDEFDVAFIPVIAYADFALVERRLCGYLNSATKDCHHKKYHTSAVELVEALRVAG